MNNQLLNMSQIKYKIMKLAKKTNENTYIGKVNEENGNQNMRMWSRLQSSETQGNNQSTNP